METTKEKAPSKTRLTLLEKIKNLTEEELNQQYVALRPSGTDINTAAFVQLKTRWVTTDVTSEYTLKDIIYKGHISDTTKLKVIRMKPGDIIRVVDDYRFYNCLLLVFKDFLPTDEIKVLDAEIKKLSEEIKEKKLYLLENGNSISYADGLVVEKATNSLENTAKKLSKELSSKIDNYYREKLKG